jgi:hypothetical protein
MSFNYIFSQRYYDNDTIEMSKCHDKIKEHISALIRIEKNNNSRIFINTMILKIVWELLKEGYSPYTYLSEEYILNKLSSIRFDDIVNKGIEWFNRNKLCVCSTNISYICLNTLDVNYNFEIIYKIIKQSILDYGVLPKCRYIFLSYQYYIQEKRLGNTQEIAEYELLLSEIEMDPEEFHNKYKHKIPTQNLSKLISKTMTKYIFDVKEPCCGVCQSEIEQLQNYYELPCEHMFHEKEEECLENATIINWLKDNKLCPICKKEVIL